MRQSSKSHGGKSGRREPPKQAVLLLTFNRPDLTAETLKAISTYRPAKLFVASDGPRPFVAEDRELVDHTRSLIEQHVSWPCEIHRLYRGKNLGLREGVIQAIDWFFEHVDEGIILEDDCVPHPDFFGYCEELLERYRDDERVWCIQGDNSAQLDLEGNASYGFIKYALVWGWATWKRAWIHFDRDLEIWQKVRGTRAVTELWPDRIERRINQQILDDLVRNPSVTWDYQWAFTVAWHRGLTTVPRVNLIRNVGWGREDATHTKGRGKRANASTASILPLRHPPSVTRDRGAERQALYSKIFGAARFSLRYQIRKHARKTIRALGRMVSHLLYKKASR